MRAGTPALPGGEPCQSHAWRGARPRARSPQGDGRPGLSPASAQPAPDAGGDARAPRRRALPVPRVERRSASSAEPAGRRGDTARLSHQPNAPQDAGEDARAPRRGALPVPRVERRSASSAEPAGRRGTRPITSLRATRAGCGRGRPRSQEGSLASPTRGEALGLERGARRATGDQAYHQPPRNGAQDAGGDARAPRGRPNANDCPLPRSQETCQRNLHPAFRPKDKTPRRGEARRGAL
jgi:hypothetical protein